MKENQVKIKW